MGKLSRNGQKIVFTREMGHFNGRASIFDVYVMDPDGSNKTWVRYPQDALQDEWASISPDGTKVAFHAWFTTNSKTNIEIVAVDLATGASARMTKTETLASPSATSYPGDLWPNWSPDGKKLVFTSQRAATDSTRDYEVFILNAVDANGNFTPENTTDNVPVQLTDFQGAASSTVKTGVATRPSFSADGTQVIFAGRDATRTNYDLYRCDILDGDGDKWGDNLVRITDIGAVKAGYTGAPNPEPVQMEPGGPIFFTSALGPDYGRLHSFRINPDGTGLFQVTGADYTEESGNASAGKLLVNYAPPAIGVNNLDVAMYTLTNDSTPGTLRGNVTVSADPTITRAGYKIEAINVQTVVETAFTDENGNWSMTVPPGGYTLAISSPAEQPVQMNTVYRGTVVGPGAEVTFNALTTPVGAQRVGGVIPTIKDGKVSIVWTGVSAASGWTNSGYNVYRASSENGPWTKVNTSLIPTASTYEFVDETPGDLTSAFYSVTLVSTNGTQTVEGMYSDAAQAANNLVFNPSFELVDANGKALGWEIVNGSASINNTTGTDDTIAWNGNRSAYIQAGATKGDGLLHMTVPNYVPVAEGQAYIEGMFGKIKDAGTSTKPVMMRAAFNLSEGAAAFKYYAGTAPTPFDTNSTAPASGNRDWTWLFNINPIVNYEFVKQVRLSPYWSPDANTTTTSRAYFDEVRYQVKRVGPTGIVWGRVVTPENKPVFGMTVSDGTRVTYSDVNGTFILRDVPTGSATITFSYPELQAVTQTISNIGGFRFPTDLVMTGPFKPFVKGRILLPTGAPAAGANVRMVVGKSSETIEKTYTATTDANGDYEFDIQSNPLDTTQNAWVVATLLPYQSAISQNKSFGVGTTRFDLKLGPLVPEILVARADGAITIDGQLNEAAWAKAQPVTLNYLFPTSGAPTVGATGFMLWDDTYLYVGLTANEPSMSTLKATATGMDAVAAPNNVISDDHMEVFVDPTLSSAIGNNREVWQFVANANTADIGYGDVLLRTGPDALSGVSGRMENTGFEVKSSTAADSWTVELKIPYEGMSSFDRIIEKPVAGTQWRGLIGRYRSAEDKFSSTSYVTGGFANAHMWNALTFVNTVGGKKGDLDNNQAVDRNDAIEALKITAGISALGNRLPQGDVAGSDNAVTIQDAARILRYTNGLDPDFPN